MPVSPCGWRRRRGRSPGSACRCSVSGTGNGLRADLHDFQITAHDTALVIAYRQKTVDLTPIGGAKVAQVLEGVVQEIDLGTGAVRFEWNSLDHVPVTESYAERPPAVVGRRVAGGVTTVFASWNGATEVVTWRVLAGPAADQLKPVADAAKTGFETATAATTGRPTSPWRRWTPVGPCSGRPIQSR